MQSDLKFSVGDIVRSVAVGKLPSFDGEIVAKIDNHVLNISDREIKVDGYYHVRDAYGKLWHRVDSELTKINEAAK